MSSITPQQALELAASYNKAASVLGDFRLNNWDKLSETERKQTAKIGRDLLGYSQTLITDAVGKLLDDTQSSLNKIKQATADANHAIQTINTIKKVINIAASLVTLAAAISTENPGAIVQALQSVISAVSSSEAAGGNGGAGGE